jgi:glycosyltransferase involved in cell wall biosynthesis
VTLDIVVPPSAVGPRRAADLIRRGLVGRGVDARLLDRPEGPRANVHLANSSRSLLLPLARRRGDLVTLHDVVPRDARVRPVIVPLMRRVLRRHHVVVHSRHAADLLRLRGFAPPVGIVPLANTVVPVSDADRARTRRELGAPAEGPLLVLAGVLKAAKAVGDVVEAAGDVPEARIVLAGRVADQATADALARRPPNVHVVEKPDDELFSRVVAAADALLVPRRNSVGETSGPLVDAHALGTPVAMLDSGSAPEYRRPQDLVLPETTTVAELVACAAERSWQRIASSVDDVVDEVLDAYCRVFADLGWLAGPTAAGMTEPSRPPADHPERADDNPS